MVRLHPPHVEAGPGWEWPLCGMPQALPSCTARPHDTSPYCWQLPWAATCIPSLSSSRARGCQQPSHTDAQAPALATSHPRQVEQPPTIAKEETGQAYVGRVMPPIQDFCFGFSQPARTVSWPMKSRTVLSELGCMITLTIRVRILQKETCSPMNGSRSVQLQLSEWAETENTVPYRGQSVPP